MEKIIGIKINNIFFVGIKIPEIKKRQPGFIDVFVCAF